jgi:hypothetical protein
VQAINMIRKKGDIDSRFIGQPICDGTAFTKSAVGRLHWLVMAQVLLILEGLLSA